MCGAFSLITDFTKLGKRFGAKLPDEVVPERQNIRPSQPVAVILNTEPEEIQYILWGVTPHFSKDGKIFLINARSDSLLKPTWKKMLREQRCLILADGFYEWQKEEGKKTKTPYKFTLKNKESFAFAGLWQMEKDESGKEVAHCVIITTEPNSVVEEIHNRMPAILTSEEEKQWLNPDLDEDEALKLLRPFEPEMMKRAKVESLKGE
jgi:putative SOS response-associated peptidase YedK